MNKPTKEILNYYHSKESRWGYKLVLGGVKHFGYYPEDSPKISMHEAMRNMMNKVGETLHLPPGSRVLDAGCGEGATAEYLAQKYHLTIEGVDLLDFNIEKAQLRAGSNTRLNFQVGDYSKLDYPDNYFDGIYTLETFVHSPDYQQTLQEFRRVLKKGGKLVLFEYSIPDEKAMSKREAWAFQTISEGSAMHSLPYFIQGSFPKILTNAGFKNIEVKDITARIVPMLRRFWIMGIVPYQIVRVFGKEKKFVNTTSGVELYRYRGDFCYNIVTALRR